MPAPALSHGATQASAHSRQISIIRTREEMVLQTRMVIVKEVCSGHSDAQCLISKEKHLFAHGVGMTPLLSSPRAVGQHQLPPF